MSLVSELLGGILGGTPIPLNRTTHFGQLTFRGQPISGELQEQFVRSIVDDRSLDHFGQVRYFRKKFKEYSKEEFRNISNAPMVKEILAGAVKIGAEEAAERIRLYLEDETLSNQRQENFPPMFNSLGL